MNYEYKVFCTSKSSIIITTISVLLIADTTFGELPISGVSGSMVSSLADFSHDVNDWTSNTANGIAGALSNTVQCDYLASTLSFSGTDAVLTSTDGSVSFRMFVDVRSYRGKRLNVFFEGMAGAENQVTLSHLFSTESGESDEWVYYDTAPSNTPFATQWPIQIPTDANVLHLRCIQPLGTGKQLTVETCILSEAREWETDTIIDERNLRKTAKWLADMDEGITNQFNVAIVGDSWIKADYRLCGPLFEKFNSTYGVGAAGWGGFGLYGGSFCSTTLGIMTRSEGWKITDKEPSLDNGAAISTNTGDTITFSLQPYACEQFRIHYDGTTTGSFRYRTNYAGVDWTTNTITGTGTAYDILQYTLTYDVAHNVTIETLSGINKLYGVHCTVTSSSIGRDKPVLHKGGLSGGRLQTFAQNSTGDLSDDQCRAFSDLSIDLIILLFGTNDATTYPWYDGEDFYYDYLDYIENLRSAVGSDVDILIMTPSINPSSREIKGTMYMYRDAQYAAAKHLKAAYVDLIPLFGFDPREYEYGTALEYFRSDEIHPTPEGAALLSEEVIKSIFNDGLPNVWKSIYFTDPTSIIAGDDFDEDGCNNLHEYIAGTNPTNSSSRFVVSSSLVLFDESYCNTIEWAPVSNRIYNILWTPSLEQTFQLLGTNFAFPQNSYTDIIHNAESQGFYKLEVGLE